MNILTENYKLYLGDCLEVMDKLIEQGVQVDCILTDPPYGTTQCKWDSIIPLDKMWERLNKIAKKDCAILLFSSQPFTTKLINSNIKKFKQEIIWDKQQPTGFGNAKRMIMPVHENIILFSNGKVTYNPQMVKREKPLNTKNWKQNKISGREDDGCYGDFGIGSRKEFTEKYPTSIFSYGRSMKECNNTKRVHPTQKPVELLEYLIKTYTNEGELVLDFTMGSGSTGVACMNTNRKFIGIELDEKYFDISINRIFENYNK
jgi:site-specific DNA-methyltransferase (adenine-specific)